MSGYVHAGLAFIAAIALHVGGFALRDDSAGAASSGAGGAELVSLQAADGAISDLVAEWDRPPSPATEISADFEPMSFDEPPNLSPPDDAAPAAVPPDLAAPPSTPDATPIADVTLPAEAAKPQPEPAATKPVQKPKPKPKPPKKPKASAPAQQGQQAAGSGKGAMAGTGGTANAATLSKAEINSLKAGWGAAIRARIEKRKRYPNAANGAAGKVTLRLSVTRAGALSGVSVAASSGHKALDQAAVGAVRAAGQFPAAPQGLRDASYSFTLPMSFAR